MSLRAFFHLIGSFSIYIFALLIGLAGTYFVISRLLFAPVDSGSTESIGFVIEKGATLNQVAEKLEAQKVIRSAFGFQLLSKLKYDDQRNKIIAGEYKLSPSFSPLKILEILISGEVIYYQLTIPPGSRASDIPRLIAETTLATEDQIRQALTDSQLMNDLNIQGRTFEGYLFPETYKFSKPIDPREVITRIVAEGRKRISNEMLERTVELGFTIHQVVTLASIIEKETGAPQDRKTISSVFHNRLKIGMPLQSDPTVIYGIANFDGNLTREHLKTPSPYNTYLNTGLPPSPICNPGLDAINAALYPAETDFLYFVAKGDGTSQFSSNLREHNEAVRKYQLGKAALIEPAATVAPAAAKPPVAAQPPKAKDSALLDLEELEKLKEAESAPSSSKKPKISQLDPVKERRRVDEVGGVPAPLPPRRPTPEQLEKLLQQDRR